MITELIINNTPVEIHSHVERDYDSNKPSFSFSEDFKSCYINLGSPDSIFNACKDCGLSYTKTGRGCTIFIKDYVYNKTNLKQTNPEFFI